MDRKYVEDHLIFDTIIGSQAYGTNISDSDVDTAGIMIPDVSYLYGLNKVEQFQDYDTDRTVYAIQKIVSLAVDNNPNILDLLCMSKRCVLKNTRYCQIFIDNKDLFISKKCKYTYLGYAFAQLYRIKTHRKYLLNPPVQKPERKDYGLKEYSLFESSHLKAVINIESVSMYIEPDKLNEFLHVLDEIYADQVLGAFKKYLTPDRKEISLAFIQNSLSMQLNTLTYLGQRNFIKEEYIDEAERELKYHNALSEWKKYQEWKLHRNKKRAELEVKYGYDCKNAMHLIRLIRTGMEILETGEVHVDRTGIDAKELIEIRNGAWSYDKVEAYANDAEIMMSELYNKSTLQKSADVKKINALLVQVTDEYIKDNK
jgi:predicted nucleotidyltransferase